MFATIHNVSFCLRIMRDARAALIEGRFDQFYREFLQAYRREPREAAVARETG